MANNTILLQFLVFGMPYWLLGLLALISTHPDRQRKGERRFLRNRFAYFGILLMVAVILCTIIAFLIFNFGSCTGGLIDPVTCTGLPVQQGEFLNKFVFRAITTTSAIGLPSLSCYVLAEAITRWRARKS